MLEIIYLKHKLPTSKHLVSLDAYNLFHCYNHYRSIFRIYKVQIFPTISHINITKTYLLHAIIIILTLQGIVTTFMQLNEMFRYSLLHKHIICTTLLFDRAFPTANWSWLSSLCTYYPAFITALKMVPELSSIHRFSHSYS